MRLPTALIGAATGFVLAFHNNCWAEGIDSQVNLMAACGKVLKPTKETFVSNKYAQLASLRTYESASHDGSGTNVTAEIPEYFNGSYSTKSDADRSLKSYDSLKWSTAEFMGYVAAYVPKDAYPAYNQCVDRVLSSQGVHLTVEDARSRAIVVRVHFVGAEGSTQPYTLEVKTTNTDYHRHLVRRVPASGYNRIYTFNRASLKKTVTVTVNVVSGPSGPKGDYLAIPPYVRTEPVITLATLTARPPSHVICSGSGNGNPVQGPDYGPPPLSSDQEFVVESAQVNVTEHGSWNNNSAPSNPPFYGFTEKTPTSLRVHTICMPNDLNKEAQINTELVYQTKTTTYKLVYPE